MTKKWSSTASMDGQTKRQSSKAARRKEAEMAKIAEEYDLDPLGDFKQLVDRLLWRDIDTAPRDAEQFILLYCAEDRSRWFASWQGGQWFGVDDMGLRRTGQSAGDPKYVTGWFVNAWMPLPEPPETIQADAAHA